jgi:hypothetical protein
MELFSDTFLPTGLGDLWFGTHRCPACGTTDVLRFVRSDDEPHWLCGNCGRCWRPVHGTLRRVDALTCHGCTARTKSQCPTLMATEFPTFGPSPVEPPA